MAMYDVGYGLSEWEFYGQVMRQTFHEQKKICFPTYDKKERIE